MTRLVFAALWVMALALSAHADSPRMGLADATVLIIRHGEKPDNGTGLSPPARRARKPMSATSSR